MSTSIQTLNNVVATNLNFSIWTGRKILDNDDLSLSGEVPPREIINLGSKHTTDPKALKVFSTLKRRAERGPCLRVGIPFMGGYAIPSDKADKLAKDLANIVDEYEQEKQAYLLKHTSIQDEWISKFPLYERILRKALTPVDVVEKRIQASFSMFRISSTDVVTSVDTGLHNEVESLVDSLDADILKTANKLAESLSKALHPNQTNVNGLKSLREKVEGLAFLNSRFSKLVAEIKKVEAAMPVAGKLSTNDANVMSGLLYRMAEPDRLAALMSNIDSDDLPTSTSTQPSTSQPVYQSNSMESDEQVSTQDEEELFDDSDFNFDFDEHTVGDFTSVDSSDPASKVTFF